MLRLKSIACAMAALLWACSSSNTQQTAGNDGSSGNGQGGSQVGGSGSGGSQSAGNAGSSTAGSAGSSMAGNAGSLSAGGTNGQGCHDAAECPNVTKPPFGGFMLCLLPGQAPPSGGCGAPQWCGQCDCPPQPMAPSGTGTPCETSQDCPAPAGVGATASVCDAGACTACAQDSDCPSALPVCGQVSVQYQGATSFRACKACAQDSDCPAERPYCQGSYGVSSCVACRTTADCQSGVCSNGACTPACGPSQPCGSALQCSAELRCEALSCQSDAACPANFACTGGHCARRACTSDAVCEGNCLSGACYDSLGTCYLQLQAA